MGNSSDAKTGVTAHKVTYSAEETKKDVIKNALGGPQSLASFGYIEGAGHTVSEASSSP